MVKTSDALRIARSLLGTPYGSGPGQLDCINLVKKIIRDAPGGQKKYTDAGTAALWASYHSSGKYKHLIWTQESIHNPEPGMLAFKGQPLGKDGQPHHVGIVTERGTVIHASSALGMVAETELNNGQWTLLAKHKYIETGGEDDEEATPMDDDQTGTMAIVTAPTGSTVNLRAAPDTAASIIRRVPIGEQVEVKTRAGDAWRFVTWRDNSGYMMAQFLKPAGEDDRGEEDTDPDPGDADPPAVDWIDEPCLISEEGAVVQLRGRWRLAID